MKRPRGVIAAGHRLTAEAAEGVLRAGGTAFDAALAALAAACATEPVLCTPGGGGFLLALPASGRPRLYDFFVHTPRERRPDSELDFGPILADFGTVTQEFHIGRGTVAVPGMVRGLFEVHRDLATMPMREIVEPALAAAREGVIVTPFQGYLFRVIQATFTATGDCHAIFRSARDPDGLVGEGERLRQPELADTLELLAVEGDDLFYRGEIADAIARDMRDGGQIAKADLEAYRVERREPLGVAYRGARVHTNPPPSSGGLLVAFGLELLAASGVGTLGFGSPEHVSLLARVMDQTAEARLEAAVEISSLDAAHLLHADFVERYRRRIAGRAASRRGTTQVSIIDAAGNLASLTVSNGEGSGYVVPGTGVVMNNMLGEEDLNPGGFQRWPRAHRMTSMMAPTAVTWPDGKRVATGSGGSNRIRTVILQLLVNLVDFGMPVEEAVCAPRVHFERGLLSVEGGFDIEGLRPVLEAFPDHKIWAERNMFFGGAHTVAATPDGMQGAGDPRRGGTSIVVA